MGIEPDDDDELTAALADAWSRDPDPHAVAVARARSLMAFGKADRRRRRTWWPVVAAAVAGVFLGGGLVAASVPDALPGDGAYLVKRFVEQARMAAAIGPEAEAAVWLDVSEARLEETVRAESAGRDELLPSILADYVGAVRSSAATTTETSDEFPGRWDRRLAIHERVLAGLIDTAPTPAVPALRRALQTAQSARGGPPHPLPIPPGVGPPEGVPPGCGP